MASVSVALVASAAVPVAASALPPSVPSTVPVFTAPAAGVTVAGSVTLSATTSAPSVRFSVDGVVIATVGAVAGVASASWQTWGAPNGTVTLSATDCDNDGCSATGTAERGVTVANSAPTVTAPTNGGLTGTRPVLRASASGGGISFLIDGATVGFDATAPYSFAITSALTVGGHTAQVIRCDSAGTRCEGAVSAAVGFTALALAPQISSVSPNPFSPNGDGRRDTTRFTLVLPDAQTATLAIRGSDGTLWRTRSLGRLGAGSHVVGWDGRDQVGRRVADGLYSIEIQTTDVRNGETFTGTAKASVRVDTVAPTMTGLSGAGTTFYPFPDGYRDSFGPQVNVGSAGTLRLFVSTSSGVRVRTLSRSVPGAGRFGLAWDGRLASGRRVAGSYRFAFETEDSSGNRRRTTGYGVVVSMMKLVTRNATRVVSGASAVNVGASDTSCGFWSTSASDFTGGLWLDNLCYDDEVVVATYGFSVPAAVRYGTIRVESYGNTISPPTVVGTLIYSFERGEWDIFGSSVVSGYSADQWSNFGTKSARGRVSSSHRVRIALGIGTAYLNQDYDIGQVKITISYSVLA